MTPTRRPNGEAASANIPALGSSHLTDGIATVAVIGSTAAVTTIEFEPGAVADFDRLLEGLAPRQAEYAHHKRWGDDNGSSHVRAAMLGPSLTIPFAGRELALGTWRLCPSRTHVN